MTNPLPTERYVLFLDLLGFRNVVNAWEMNGRQASLVELVRWISTATSSYKTRVTQDGGSVGFAVTPAITTFSDCIVISFPTAPPVSEVDAVSGQVWKGEVLRHMADLCARITVRSLHAGLVLRGGLCQGVLVHEGGRYIIGPGLNEAYRLESEVADVPRIVVGRSLYDREPELLTTLLAKDRDGEAYLDYMPHLVQEIQSRADAGVWRTIRLQQVEDIIASAKASRPPICFWRRRRASIREKWQWFHDYFAAGTLALSDG